MQTLNETEVGVPVIARRAVLIAVLVTAISGCHHAPKPWELRPPSPPATPAKVFDVTWTRTDPNGVPLNPVWGSQSWTTGAALPPAQQAACAKDPRKCTGQRVVADWAPNPSICRAGVATGLAGPIAAHFDWSIATYSGFVRPSTPAISDDNDFNFVFQPDDPGALAGLTEANSTVPFDASKKYIELELHSLEVKSRFSLKWWRDFADDSDRVVRSVIIGLFGVDCEHGCKSELHPVYAIMVETDPSPVHNTWQIFVRNWGNGGSCSTFDHQFNGKTLTLKIPPPSPGAALEQVQQADFARSDAAIVAPVFSSPQERDGLLVSFGLAPPATRALEELAVTVRWSGAVAAPRPPALPLPPPPPSAAAARTSATPGPITEAAYILRVVDSLPPEQRSRTRQQIIDALKRPNRGTEKTLLTRTIDTTIHPNPTLPIVAGSRSVPQATRLEDTETDRSKKVWSTLCRVTQGQLPPFNGHDITSICRSVDWKGPQ